MCGIAGIVSRAPRPAPPALVDALDRRLAHRGPDDRGVYASPDGLALLVHRRLSLIDLSSAGRQPMTTPDGRHWLAYNGECYNYRSIRAELESRGERFTSGSDSEVLLRLLACEGPAALARVRGMFALAWWDSEARTLLLARDRYGIKPLYFAERDGRVAFASEVRALLETAVVPRTIDAAGVLAYLRWGSVPAPLTWIDGVESLPPGTWQRWTTAGRRDAGTFADVRHTWVTADSVPDEPALIAAVRTAAADSIRAHMVADVPVGVFLSGGKDSAALVALARPLVADLRTYTVVVDDPEFDEADVAAETARHFATQHQTLRVVGADLPRDWATIVAHLDQPTNDGINTYYVSRAVAATGVKAVLSGVGGDELFGGYSTFRRLPLAERIGKAAGGLLPMAARLARGGVKDRAVAARLQHVARHAGDRLEIYRGLRGLLLPDELGRFLGPRLVDARDIQDRVAAVEQATLAAAGPERALAAASRLESVLYMRSQLLRDVDVMSMAHGLEVRVPFIDHELAHAVWPALGAHPSLVAGKRLLTDALPSPLPPGVAGQPKRGFTLPFARWIHGPLSDLVRSGLHDLAADGWIAPAVPDALWQQLCARRVHWSRPWALGVLGRFLRDA
jgi:asparagine synthase (glutamine-hydrolysing)